MLVPRFAHILSSRLICQEHCVLHRFSFLSTYMSAARLTIKVTDSPGIFTAYSKLNFNNIKITEKQPCVACYSSHSLPTTLKQFDWADTYSQCCLDGLFDRILFQVNFVLDIAVKMGNFHNDSIKKTLALMSKKTTLHVHHTFRYISLLSSA